MKTAFTRVCVTSVLILVILHVTPLVPAISRWLTDDWRDAKGDVLIVLGADQLDDGTLGVVSYWRALYAANAWRDGDVKRIIITGGRLGRPDKPSVAGAMGNFMAALGVPREAITLEERSMTTHENALFTATIIRDWPGTKVLLTSDCHMRRARRAFANAGINVIPAPIPDIGKRWNSWLLRWDCAWSVGIELVKLAYYKLHGWA